MRCIRPPATSVEEQQALLVAQSFHELAILSKVATALGEAKVAPQILITQVLAGERATPRQAVERVERAYSHQIDRGVADAIRVYGRETPWRIRRLLRATRPAVVILCNDTLDLSRIFINEAHKLSLPVVLVQEGAQSVDSTWVVRYSLRSTVSQAAKAAQIVKILVANGEVGRLATWAVRVATGSRLVKDGYGQSAVDLFCVMDETVAASYRRAGSRAARIVPTGIPLNLPVLAAFRRASSPAPAALILTFPYAKAGRLTAAAQRELYEEIATIARAALGTVILRRHPRDRDMEYNLNATMAEGTFAEACARATLAVGIASTALLEASLLGALPIAYTPGPWVEKTAALVVLEKHQLVARTREELRETMLKFASSAAASEKCAAVARDVQVISHDAESRIAANIRALLAHEA